ncbi:MAG: MarR family transcriptional regulator [Gammaproteobacteria bacterium]
MNLQPAPRPEDRESAASEADRLEIRMWLRLLTCTTLIERQLRNRLSSAFDTTLPRFDALAQLERVPDGLTMGQLSARMMVSGGNVTGVVDRLVKDGLVERVDVPGDRRRNLVRLTDEGRARFAEMAAEHHRTLHRLLADLDHDAIESLFALLGRLKDSVRNQSDA